MKMIESDKGVGVTNTGFESPTEFCLRLEQIKKQHQFDTYIETILYFTEYESDVGLEQISAFLNKKIRDAVEYEARQRNLLKDNNSLNELF